jgi:hypothetical protein
MEVELPYTSIYSKIKKAGEDSGFSAYHFTRGIG